MDLFSLLLLAVALAMDAFAVAMATGISLCPLSRAQIFRLSFNFGLFQAIMPLFGWGAGKILHSFISAIDHWVAFGLLVFVGGKMLYESLAKVSEQNPSCPGDPTKGWTLIMLSLATSIDALAVGLSLAMVGAPIVRPALVIGVVAAGFTAAGMLLGSRIGSLWGKRVEVFGGLILIGIGTKILFEHLGRP